MVSPTKVSFLSSGIEIAAELYTPSPGSPNRKGAAIIVGHPYTGVKEQTAAYYAQYYASSGFYALAFDAAYQGESKGEPRGLENPAQRVEDFKNAVSYLTTLAGKIDVERIGAVGICGGGGYVSVAAQSDVRIKAVVPIVPFDVGHALRHNGPNEEDAFNATAIAAALQFSANVRSKEAAGEAVEPVPLLPNSVKEIPAELGSFMKRGTHYYKTKEGFHHRATGLVHPRSFDLMVAFDAFAFNNLISPRPILVIGGEKAETLHFAREAYDKASEPKELLIVKGKGHFDVYHDASEIGPKTIEFFNKYLSF
ncbi:hydrolase of the alpha/beta superfamily [Bisporella sp. PMI_857]|nr:hydrolase of the alpha/beta superfamily [Bisporella sp. PMI_857]